MVIEGEGVYSKRGARDYGIPFDNTMHIVLANMDLGWWNYIRK